MERVFNIVGIDMCRACSGTGRGNDGNKCELCDGNGLVEVEKEVYVRVRPYNPHNEE